MASSPCTAPVRDGSFARRGPLAAAIKGRPRWRDTLLERVASEQGAAAAVLEAYEQQGRRFLTALRGRFALCVLDARSPSALLAIDRFGIERLCFAHSGDDLVFGTSAEDVARSAAVSPRLNRQAIFDYLYCQVVPSPETIFAGVEKLLPAQCLVFDGKGVNREFYWRLRHPSGGADSLDDLEARLRDLLRAAVLREADRADVGAFLSGGTDSSTVSGLLTQVTGRSARTFSVGFSARGYDEIEYARIASRHFGTESREIYVTPKDVAEVLPLVARAYDEPFGNASAVPTYVCARLARDSGVGLLLAGDGGDEIFGGNARYAKQKVFERYVHLPLAARRVVEPDSARRARCEVGPAAAKAPELRATGDHPAPRSPADLQLPAPLSA